MFGLNRWQIYLILIIAGILLLLGFLFGWKIVAGIIGLGAAAETKRRISKTDEDIKKAKEEAGQANGDYEEMIKQHDEEIKKAGDDIEKKKYDNASDAADGITDFLNSDS